MDSMITNQTPASPILSAYYFPNYHADARNAQRYGSGWTEWELVKRAVPRFEGHNLPLVPKEGYLDEANPAVMQRKIATATSHGIGHFIFDWYYYNDGPFLQRALDEGFLGAPNSEEMAFSLMWANHDWMDIFPAKPGVSPALSARPAQQLTRSLRCFHSPCHGGRRFGAGRSNRDDQRME